MHNVGTLRYGIIFGWMMTNMGQTVKYMDSLTFLIGYALFAMGVATPLLLGGAVFVGLANGIGMPYLNTIASIKGGKDLFSDATVLN